MEENVWRRLLLWLCFVPASLSDAREEEKLTDETAGETQR